MDVVYKSDAAAKRIGVAYFYLVYSYANPIENFIGEYFSVDTSAGDKNLNQPRLDAVKFTRGLVGVGVEPGEELFKFFTSRIAFSLHQYRGLLQ